MVAEVNHARGDEDDRLADLAETLAFARNHPLAPVPAA